MKQILSTRRVLQGALAAGMALAACLPALAQDDRDERRPRSQEPGQVEPSPRHETAGRQRGRADAPQRAQAEQPRSEQARPERTRPEPMHAPGRERDDAARRDDSRQRAADWQRQREQAQRDGQEGEQRQRDAESRRQTAIEAQSRAQRERVDRQRVPERWQGHDTDGRAPADERRDAGERVRREQAQRDWRQPDRIQREQAQRVQRERQRGDQVPRQDAGPDRRNPSYERRGDDGRADAMRRLGRDQQESRIRDERQRAERFQREREHERRMAEQRAEQRARALQQQRRMAQYRYQQRYHERLREQQRRWHAGSYDYWRDPFYYTPASYRYSYGGRWYQTNRYGADLMRQAVSYGYEEGLRAGRADRDDGWRYDASGSYGYLDASYGYDGRYIAPDQYSYYFRQGFQRGYEDGYYGRYRYGSRDERGDYRVLAAVLGVVLGLQLLH